MRATRDFGIPEPSRARLTPGARKVQKHYDGWVLIDDPTGELRRPRPSRYDEPITIPAREMEEYRRCAQDTAYSTELARIVAGSYEGCTFEFMRDGELTGQRVTVEPLAARVGDG